MSSQDDIAALLAWYQEAGVTATAVDAPAPLLGLEPARRKPSAPPAQKRPAQRAAPPSNPEPAATHLAPALERAANAAGAAVDLASLRQAIADFDGSGLRETATNLVFADGNPEANLMLLGEAPGADEDRQGLPFVGVSGQLLDRMMACIGYDRTRFYISNILPWRPPGNRKPTADEIGMFLPFVRRHIALVRPTVLLLLGGTALTALSNTNQGIMRTRGRWFDLDIPGLIDPVPAIPTFHPAFL
ncbi:MAG: uracil-DNA glycosylase, partial [Pseudomonadota bacterium]